MRSQKFITIQAIAVLILGILLSSAVLVPDLALAQDYDESIPSWTNPEDEEEDMIPPPPPPPPEPFLEPQPDLGSANSQRNDTPSGLGSTGGENFRGMGRYQGGNPSGVEFKRLKDSEGRPVVRPSKEERLKSLRNLNRKPKRDSESNP